MDKLGRNHPKKPYTQPSLTVYGTILELTKMVGQKHNPDGGRFPRNATSLKP
jgi:hypothetical protein